jgi:dolichol-phosphate mannosyltransferase
MIYIVIPIFNEEQNITNLYNELAEFSFNEDHFFVFSDDGSTDNTIIQLQKQFPKYKTVVLGDGINRGPGAAFNTGFEWVLQNSTSELDSVVTIEADCTSDLGILSDMLSLNKMKYDLVLASVYAQGGGFDSTGFIRKFISSVANLLYRFAFDIKVQTISSFYRVYDISLLRRIKSKYSNLIEENGFICMLEILTKAIHCEAKIIEVPMVLKSTKRLGKSKMKIVKTTIDYLKFLLKLKLKK